MTSTLIETININADDFTDNFLTCPTCMSPYDDTEHAPKLLPCSHTLCRCCLERIASTAAAPLDNSQNRHTLNTSPSSLITANHSNSISRSIAAADAAAAAMNGTGSGSDLNNSNNSPRLMSNISRVNLTQPVPDLYIRCPICRESIILPRGASGISNLPPSFIINQLLDLVKNQRRDLVPRCKNHTNEELLFCETCDIAFCSLCESHCRVVSNADHIVIPFSIAIKRMTEIFLFKSNQCINSFNLALANVQREIESLNTSVNNQIEFLNASFDDIKQIIENRRKQLLDNLLKIKETKTKSLNDQIKLILNEKQKVESECQQYHTSNVECKLLGAQIQNINEKLDCLRSLCEPRENSFISYDYKFNNCLEKVEESMATFGKFNTSNTYPPLCSAKILDDIYKQNTNNDYLNSTQSQNYPANLSIYIQVQTVDYYGRKRVEGGDPISILITDPFGRQYTFNTPTQINDLNNGVYICKFIPNCIGKYRIDINIFKRQINQMPMYLNVIENIDSLWTFGGGGSGSGVSQNHTVINGLNSFLNKNKPQSKNSTIINGFNNTKGNTDRDFNMPICVRCINGLIYVLDSGNSRIKVLNYQGQFIRHIYHAGLNQSSSTALAAIAPTSASIRLFSINWRLRLMSDYELTGNADNEQLKTFDLIDKLEEPIGLMETFHPEIFIIQDKKKLNLCTNTGEIIYESLEQRMKTECSIKNITAFCSSLIKPRIFIADSCTSPSTGASVIYEFDLDWLCDYKLGSLIENFNLTRVDLGIDQQFMYKKFSMSTVQQQSLSTSLTSLNSNISINSTTTTSTTNTNVTQLNLVTNNNLILGKGTYTALWFDLTTNKLLAAKCDKQKTVIEIFNSNTYFYEYSIESSQNEKRVLKRVTSMCSTDDGRVICVDLVQNLVKMFRFV